MVSVEAVNGQTHRSTPGAEVTPIAVIGMACRLPGGIDSPEKLWDALVRGDDLVTEVPADRWDADEHYDPDPQMQGRSVSKWGAFLDDVASFDADFFGIDDAEATALDPQQRLLLETSWEVVEHAGILPRELTESLTGVFIGLTHVDYQIVGAHSDPMNGPHGVHGNVLSMASGRIAHALRTHGPAVTVDTAGSSSLLAVHMACRSLDRGESDLALAGGACVLLEPRRFAAASAQGLLSPTGRCRAFDAAADGLVAGEGAGMVMLKRLPEALRDGDRILAVIHGTAANQNGRVLHNEPPSQRAQTAVYRNALATAGFDPSTVGMVEAHGAGLAFGDPIEFASLAEVYGVETPCAVASVKTNLGHTQAAAGVLGLMKTVLALQHGVVPPNLHFTQLPDALDRVTTNLFVPQRVSPWSRNGGQPRRAAVTSYGLSGTNVHGVLEQAPAPPHVDPINEPVRRGSWLYVLSASSADALRRTAGRLADWVGAHDDVALPDLAYTLARRRAHRPLRTAVSASDKAELVEALREIAQGDATHAAALEADNADPVWVFSDQGSQWPGMGADLLVKEPAFAATVALAEPVILRECGFSVTEALSVRQPLSGQDRIQPTLFTMQLALAAALKAAGVRPGAVIGHSVGEVAAAVVSGALSFEDGLQVVCRRAQLMSRISGDGATASVDLPAQQVLSELALRGNEVAVAAVTSPNSTVIAGSALAVRELVAAWQQRNVEARELPTELAFHSAHIDPIVGELTESLAGLHPMTPEVPFYSTTSYDPREQPACDGRYWAANMRRMVRFAAAVRAALEDGHRIFTELAPDWVLAAAVEDVGRSLDVPVTAISVMRRERDLPYDLRDFVGELHCAGGAVDFSALYPDGTLVDAPLPAWTRRQLWFRDDAHSRPTGHSVSAHPLLGPHVHLREEPERHIWQSALDTDRLPWLPDHQIHGAPVFPAAIYCEMALSAAGTVLGDAAEVRDIRFEHVLVGDTAISISTVATAESPDTFRFVVETYPDRAPVRHAAGAFHRTEPDTDDSPSARDVPALLAAHATTRQGEEIRDRLRHSGLQYGPAFTGLVAVHTGDEATDTVVAEIAVNATMRCQHTGYCVHPGLLDACFQSVTALATGTEVTAAPTGIGRLRAYGQIRDARYCYTRLTGTDDAGIEADIEVLDQHGAVLLVAQRARFAITTSDSQIDQNRADLFTVGWQQRQLPEPPKTDPGTWLLIACGTGDALSAELTKVLETHGAHCTSMEWLPGSGGESAELFRNRLRGAELTGVVWVGQPPDGDEPDASRARDCVQQLVCLARELAQAPGESPRLYAVTHNAQTVLADERPNLTQAGVRGLIRVIGNEHPELGAAHIDVDDVDGTAEHLARQLLVGSEEDETAWRGGQWYTARLHPAPLLPEERRTAVADPEHDGIRVQIRTPGDLESVELVACERIPPGAGQVEVAVRSSSVNLADALVASGGAVAQLGADFAGVVTAVGPGVTHLKPGDHVGGLDGNGCWGTFVTCDARLAVPLPAGLDFGTAAAVTTTHALAHYALRDVAHVTAGDKVLIHSAAGGVGQAAIAIARAAGAEVFTTAGSEARRDLLRSMGIERVYDSRSGEFAALIRRDTQGYGVDIVLNSASGAARRAGLELLAPGGRFVDVGKHDMTVNIPAGSLVLQRNSSFHPVDLELLAQSHPERLRVLLSTVYRLVADETLPSPQYNRYPLANAAEAIRALSGARHTGRLVLDMPVDDPVRVVMPPAQAPVCRRDGAYIVTGGLGRLGLFFAERLSADGAGRIVLCSRTQPSPATVKRVESLRMAGADVVVECGDIAASATASRLVDIATATGLPVRGALHAAAVTDIGMLADLTEDTFDRDWAPRVLGAWNLHTATVLQPLDWFCSFSSAAALVGAPGHGAYAAADSWLQGFARWRRDHGLPATTIAWGAVADTTDAIAPQERVDVFDALLRHDRPFSACGPVAGTAWLSTFAQRTPFAEAFRVRPNTAAAEELRARLDALPREDWAGQLRKMISDQVSVVLRRSIDPDRPLTESGIDSLGALELCGRVEATTGVRVRAPEVTTIRALAELICERLAPT
ncbi:beta-ketoacyl synthase N-terminal-like domain-containing protein [Mycobacterium sp. NPDC048908]|uniref:sulfolipid-1 biosynthesis phthioceranic/hydroxyphthioceranic acid synthase n=1 Tax=Mycobacterium sp. NPDC048908 TaxID=3364292 RepID=UPI0037158C49